IRVLSEGPEIAVESPAANGLSSGTASLNLVSRFPAGESPAQPVVVRNPGSQPLVLELPAIAGPNAANFRLNITAPPAPVPPGGQTSFTVTFVPSQVGVASATLSIVNNDLNESPFTINLAGQAFSAVTDADNDGLNDWAEVKLSGLGFDWQ